MLIFATLPGSTHQLITHHVPCLFNCVPQALEMSLQKVSLEINLSNRLFMKAPPGKVLLKFY